MLPSFREIQLLVTQMTERRLDKSRTGHLPNGKVKSLTNLPLTLPVRDNQASSFGSTVNIIASHLRVNETSTSDFYRISLPSMATSSMATSGVCNGAVAPILGRGHVRWMWRKRTLAQI